MSENMDTTTTKLDIFKLAESDLYDDEDAPENEMEEMARPKRKFNKGKVLVGIAFVSLCLAICGLGFGINRNTVVKKIEKELTASKQEVANREAIINDLNVKIAEKDAEINTLKGPQADVKLQQENGEKPKEQQQEVAGKTAFGTDGSIYTVSYEYGMNIRAEASASAEVIASLAKGDQFEQEGEVIKLDDGSAWIKFKWDDGYGCIQAADGTWLAKLS